MYKFFSAVCLLALALAGHGADQVRYLPHQTIKVKRVSNFKFAGGIDDPRWAAQPAYDFMKLVIVLDDCGRTPVEGGTIQFLYDEKYFYVRSVMHDSDVVNTATANGGHFYRTGDLIEIFIKCFDKPYYWEIYGTPNKLNTRFQYKSRGTLGLPSGFTHAECNILVDARVDGTLNEGSDRDRSWTVLMAVPLAELKKYGASFEPGSKWLLLIARYNFTRFMAAAEISTFPQAAMSNHASEYYALMELTK